ncbi:hypothetical protein PV328_006066 [Microctonus aethiopoides]|uniref:Uncharacterized protein n=1 Tax=Microctonus aethiopoides TaxID=144406 RepID=A0AA39FNB6_9HYME|nr:hypothetical protein PV328_006066 [Microctonus aethiopoides]
MEVFEPLRVKTFENTPAKGHPKFETIYGLRYCSINIHLLLHLPDDVELLGPLWVNSCFSFENINGQLIKKIQGTSNLDSQISKYHLQLLRFASRISNIRDGPIKNFLLHRENQVKITESFDGCHSIGSYRKINEIPVAVQQAMGLNDIGLNNMKYLGKILYFIKMINCDCYDDECLCAGVHQVIINTIKILGNLAIDNPPNVVLQHMFQCEVMDDIIVILVENLITPCFTISNNNFLYIAEPVNKCEFE